MIGFWSPLTPLCKPNLSPTSITTKNLYAQKTTSSFFIKHFLGKIHIKYSSLGSALSWYSGGSKFESRQGRVFIYKDKIE